MEFSDEVFESLIRLAAHLTVAEIGKVITDLKGIPGDLDRIHYLEEKRRAIVAGNPNVQTAITQSEFMVKRYTAGNLDNLIEYNRALQQDVLNHYRQVAEASAELVTLQEKAMESDVTS